jgi:hypothetical protein
VAQQAHNVQWSVFVWQHPAYEPLGAIKSTTVGNLIVVLQVKLKLS